MPVAPIFNDISLYAVRKEVKGLQLIHFSNPLWKRFGLVSKCLVVTGWLNTSNFRQVPPLQLDLVALITN